jgi:hypothetical protein
MRFLIIFLLFFPLLSFASQPAKVVGVIPVKFNSKGMHAPTPYSQQIMQRGYTRVPTLNLPFTFDGGGQFNPRYQPTKVTKKSFARGLGYLAGRAANMTPATKALLIGYGAYEANCVTQNFPSLCVSSPFDSNSDLSDFTDFHNARTITNATCASAPIPNAGGTKVFGCGTSQFDAFGKALTAHLKEKNIPSPNGCGNNCLSATYSVASQNPPSSASYNLTITSKTNIKPDGSYSTVTQTISGGFVNFSYTSQNTIFVCPPVELVNDSNPADVEKSKYTNGPITVNGSPRCFKNSYETSVTPEWVEQKLEENPQPVIDSDVGLDDFVDWETGLPRPDVFEDPTLDPVSDAFAEAAEAIANGTVQHTNPAAQGYVPAEMMPNLLVQINNWHEGDTFVDVFNGKTVTPESPPPEKTDIDWSKFPGLTKSQYEASNNAWGNSATQGAPNINSEVDKLTQEHDKLKDYINEPPPPLPFEINLIDLINLPTSNGCQGFTLPASINGEQKSIRVDQHCPPYDAWGRPVISWLLSLYTILLCFQIFRRTLEVTF